MGGLAGLLELEYRYQYVRRKVCAQGDAQQCAAASPGIKLPLRLCKQRLWQVPFHNEPRIYRDLFPKFHIPWAKDLRSFFVSTPYLSGLLYHQRTLFLLHGHGPLSGANGRQTLKRRMARLYGSLRPSATGPSTLRKGKKERQPMLSCRAYTM